MSPDGYRNGKAISAAFMVIFMIGGFYLLDTGACSQEPVTVGDKTTCLYLTQSVSAGDTIEESMIEERETVVDSTDFNCARHFMLYKNRTFDEDVEAGTMLLPDHFEFEEKY